MFLGEGLTNNEWSQHIASASDYVQIQEEDGRIPVENTEENINPDLNTVQHDSLIQVSPPEPLHGGTVYPPQTQHEAALFLEPTGVYENANSMPSPSAATAATAATTTPTPSPPDSQGHIHVHHPNVTGSPYHCAVCDTSSKTKRDHERHLATRKHQNKTSGSNSSGSDSTAAAGFHCLVSECEYSPEGGKAFTREDNLWRHMKKGHPVKARA
ncbi:hypothetical protein B0T20DRAFT_389293 [Sordaria brevicollis]|uniref:C2H2-type domain-containing protein n=1 Tax=Sordaria brevicollis TaxID=83679 RepID=A0AAE0UEM8_SORBR|nr:hypothetical protein B0T20DRAFT_389293 [Sordaria brevicollis]